MDMTNMKVTLFICFIITLFIFFCLGETVTTRNIDGWCTQTPHYQTCHHYVIASNTTTTTISINQFLDMTVQAAIDEARVVLKRAQEIQADYLNVPVKSLWHSCVDYFDGIVFTLNKILDHPDKVPSPLDVHTWLSASLTYINTCEKGFDIVNITNMLPAVKSTNLTELLLNSLAISVVIVGSNSPPLHEWSFNDKHKLSNLAMNKQPDVVVAKDGSGNFTSVQEVVNSAGPRSSGQSYTIYVKSGVYEEQVVISQDVSFVTMYGDGIGKTIITANRHLGGDNGTSKVWDLKASATFQVWGSRFIAMDLTFRNTAGPEGVQAVAFLSASDTSAVYHYSIEGYQDTLYVYSSRQFYKECQIFGTVDFIFGAGHAVFQDCDIFFRKPLPGGGLVVTASGCKHLNESTGYTLQGCKIRAGDDLKPVIGEYKKAFLGRPWFPYAQIVFMQSFLDDLMDPAGWVDWNGYNETAYYGEYENYGPGSSTDQRVKWQGYHVITNPNIAQQFTVAELITGNEWLPATGVPFVPKLET